MPYTPDPKDPINSSANGTKPVEGLEKTLRVELIAGAKKKVLRLEPAFSLILANSCVHAPVLSITSFD